jgi:peptidoglycan/LPS O-acetylase OafA/YrhL
VAPALNVSMGVLTAYLVVTSLTTVRPPAAGPRWLDRGLMLVAFAVGGTMLAFGIEALVTGRTRDEIPALPFLLFGVIALLAGAGDLRVVRSGAPTGAARLARHLWRMSFALFIAAMSFFIGQAKVFPKPVRILPLLALPVLAVLATMLYWLWRVRVRRTLRGLVVGGAPRVA